MKKKGFTLIELLAVIVILAIIALIATPLVLKYIENSRQESKVDSAYSYVRNLETEITNYSIKNNGKKYNKAPKNGDYYELTDFEEDKKFDTTVKGDNPDTIKVCLSNLGQVEKAMFEYGKYYVSYDGKKGSISDSDTYSSFSCNSNGVSTVIVPKQEVEFSYNSDSQIYLGVTSIDVSDLEIPELYNLIIDETQVYTMINSYNDGILQFVNDSATAMIMVQGDTMQIGFYNELLGKHTVELVRSNQSLEPRTIVRILESGRIAVSSADLFGGDAVSVVIKDLNNNNVLADISTLVEGQNSINSFYTNAYYQDVYTALQGGTKVSVVVKRQRGDSEIETIFESNATPILNTTGTWGYGKYYYYVGNDILPQWSLGN